MSEENVSNTALTVVSTLLKTPMIRVNRSSFLLEILDPKGNLTPEQHTRLLTEGPIKSGIFKVNEIERVARELCQKRRWQSSGTSFMAGLPGGLAMAATIPADTMQFWGFSLKLAQEISYLYGNGDLWNGGELDENKVQSELMIFMGTMLGVAGSAALLRQITVSAGNTMIKNMARTAITKTAWYPILKQIAKYVGIKITKDTVQRGASKVIPVLGGVLSGALTYATLGPMSNRLINAFSKSADGYTEEEMAEDQNEIRREMPEIFDAIYTVNEDDPNVVSDESADFEDSTSDDNQEKYTIPDKQAKTARTVAGAATKFGFMGKFLR
ncbi:hypothetical protein [Lonepinella sp. BR2474]|uniref:hypothetical protein n=1 Tax=Lonepinella sp. BR2474 TaxID=3434548 RepID=UPI003F6DCEE6